MRGAPQKSKDPRYRHDRPPHDSLSTARPDLTGLGTHRLFEAAEASVFDTSAARPAPRRHRPTTTRLQHTRGARDLDVSGVAQTVRRKKLVPDAGPILPAVVPVVGLPSRRWHQR